MFASDRPVPILVDGVSLNTLVVGKGPPLLLLHGWTNNWRIWQPLAALLAQQHQLILVDMPGFGQSDRLDDYSMDRCVVLLRGLVRQLNIIRPAVAGLSLGSFVAAHVAEQHADLFGDVILVGPILVGRKKRMIQRILWTCRWLPWLGWLMTRTIQSPWSGYIMERFINSRVYDPEMTGRFRSLGRREFSQKAYVDFGSACFEVDVESAILSSKRRILLVYGDNDKHAKPARLAALAAKRKGIEIACIPGAAHNSPFEAPEATAVAFAAFLSASGNSEPGSNELVESATVDERRERLIEFIE